LENVGLSDVETYNSSLGFSHYITEHIGKTEINSWDFLSNFNLWKLTNKNDE